MHLKRVSIICLCFVFLFVTGCSKASSTGAPESSGKNQESKETSGIVIDPSTLLTREEAETLLGVPVKDPELKDTKNALGQKLCMFSPKSGSERKFIQLSLVQNEGLGKALKNQGYSAAKLYKETTEKLANARPVSGIGDEASWGINGLHILKGNVYLNISVGNSGKAENLELAKKVAEKVVGRLK